MGFSLPIIAKNRCLSGMLFSPGMMYTVHNFVRSHLVAVARVTSPAAGRTLGRKQAPEAEGIRRNQKFLFSQIDLQVD